MDPHRGHLRPGRPRAAPLPRRPPDRHRRHSGQDPRTGFRRTPADRPSQPAHPVERRVPRQHVHGPDGQPRDPPGHPGRHDRAAGARRADRGTPRPPRAPTRPHPGPDPLRRRPAPPPVPHAAALALDERAARARLLQGQVPHLLPARPARPLLGPDPLGPRGQHRHGALA
jgi:hypothetical protein